MNCPECGASNRTTNTFCDECGGILVSESATRGFARPRLVIAALAVGLLLVGAVAWAMWPTSESDIRATADDAPADECCHVCRAGKACGDTCIDADETCTAEPGCACQGAPCCRVCRVGRACGDTCIDADATCAAEPGCACDAE